MKKPDHPLLSPANFGPASFYLLLLGILSAVLVDLNSQHHLISLEWLALLLVATALLGGYRLLHRLQRAVSRGREVITLIEQDTVKGAAALIVFVSQGAGRTSALQAAEYHANLRSLKHFWLITTRAAESDAEWVRQEIAARHAEIRIHELQFLEDKDNIREAKSLVEHLRKRAIDEFLVSEAEVICDFTGLTKNASAGMILACAPRDARLQYMVANRLTPDGRADPSAGSRPREVFIQYTVVEED